MNVFVDLVYPLVIFLLPILAVLGIVFGFALLIYKLDCKRNNPDA